MRPLTDKQKKITEPSAPRLVGQPGSVADPKPAAEHDPLAPAAPDAPGEADRLVQIEKTSEVDKAAAADETGDADRAADAVLAGSAGLVDAPAPPGSERTPLDIATTLHDLPAFEDDDEQERTVEALSMEAFGDDSPDSPDPPRGQTGALDPDEFSVPTRRADEKYKEMLEADIAQAKQTGFDQEFTTVGEVDEKILANAAGVDPPPVTQGEEYYRDLVEEEISFSKATGYDKEGTAIVPLAELARREEIRLRRGVVESQAEDDEEPDRSIPVGEIIDVLRAARTVEEVAGVLVEIVSNLIPRVLLLWERRGLLFGFASRGMDLTEVKLLTMEIPKGVMQQMAAAALDLESFQGPPNTGGLIGRFFDLLGPTPAEVLIIPIQVTAEDRWLLYADNELNPLPEFELRLLEVVASRAGARADWLLDRQSIW